MGPLIPYEIIPEGFNYISALFIGIAFGFILEQAGFSSSRKLAGLFYGYDFVVLKVFFTAAVTAILGIIFLGYFNVLDISVLYVNPTYIWGAIIGGAIMGLGFIFGGFCPGTSVCAASVGKIDAMAFIGGTFIGIFIFAEAYPLFESIHLGYFFEEKYVYNVLGVSKEWFAFWVIVVAIVAFAITSKIEQNYKNRAKNTIPNKSYSSYALPIVVIFIFAVIMLNLPSTKTTKFYETTYSNMSEKLLSNHYILPDEAAFYIVNHNPNYVFIDVRTDKEYAKFKLPDAKHTTLKEITKNASREKWAPDNKKIVFYSNDNFEAEKAYNLAIRQGFKDVFVLQGGLNNLFATLQDTISNSKHKNYYKDKYYFRKNTLQSFIDGTFYTLKKQKSEGSSDKPKKAAIKVSGGC